MTEPPRQSDAIGLGDIARLFFRLGATAFGGPAAHIAMMHNEVVRRRKWLEEQHFLDLLGATNLIPGPNSTEMAIHVGRVGAGVPGLVVAGIAFIAPAMAIVLSLAWAYVEFGSTPTGRALLYGVEPVVIAIVVHALFTLGRTAAKSWTLGVVGVAAAALYLAGVNEIAVIFGSGLAVMLALNLRSRPLGRSIIPVALSGLELGQAPEGTVSIGGLFFVFLKVGALLYGSGYVLLAFLRNDLVQRLGWLTDQQLLDAISIGQVTPGPVFTTATFVGYVLGGLPAAIAATVAIFLPSFVFVAATNPLIPRLRESRWAGTFLDGVTVAALGLMAGVTWQLARSAIVDVPTVILAIAAGVALWRLELNSGWLVLAGGTLGVAISALD